MQYNRTINSQKFIYFIICTNIIKKTKKELFLDVSPFSLAFYAVLSKPILNQKLIISRNYEPKKNIFDITLKRVTLAPDGFTRSLATINGQYPGPTIEVKKGDRIVINVRNELGEPTSIHSHGMFQRGTPWFDGVPGQTQCLIPDNYAFTYDFTVPDQAGTYWYHSHAMTQYVDGVVGALIIHDPDDPYLNEYDEEIIVMLTDYHHTEAEILLKKFLTPSSEGDETHGVNLNSCLVPDNGLINGKNNFDCSKAPHGSKCVDNSGLAKFEFVSNKRYRLRIINTSAFSAFFFSIDKHEMEVIETCMPDDAKKLSIVKAIVHYDGAPEDSAPKDVPWKDFLEECIDLKHETLQPLCEENLPKATKEMELTIAFHNDSSGVVRAFLNESSYEPDIKFPTLSRIFAGKANNFPRDRNAYIFDTPGEVVDITFINTDDGDHPFHMHGHQFWVLGFGNGTHVDKKSLNTVNPIKRDTSTIPASGWTVLRFVPDNPGVFGIHCHMIC
ncbi:unnamed protein product [Rhizophagus irregularis]|nr:unnamed protein product [Rhizophagus irregularis]